MKNIILTLFIVIGNLSYSQKDTIIIKGLVYDVENCEALVFSTVVFNFFNPLNTLYATCDLDGKFQVKMAKKQLLKNPVITVKEIGYEFDTIYLSMSNYNNALIIYGKKTGGGMRGPDVGYEEPLIDPDKSRETVTREEYSKMSSFYPTPNVQYRHEYYNNRKKIFRTIDKNSDYIAGQGILHISRYNSDSLLTSIELISDYRSDTAVYRYYQTIKYDNKNRMVEQITWDTNKNKLIWRENYNSADNRIYYEVSTYKASVQISGFKARYFYRKNEKVHYKYIIEQLNDRANRK